MTTLPDYLFEVSWEVCNRVGGIYAVLSTKAKTLQELMNNRVLFIGPDLSKEQTSPYFSECETPFSSWADAINSEGRLKVRMGRWDVPGKPIAILVDFSSFWKTKDELFAHMWEWYGVESDKANGDYDESCVFAHATAYVIEHCYSYHRWNNKRVVAHFNEWTVGMGALHLKHHLPQIGTLFTTHATSIGRSIACNNKELYKYFDGYNGDQMASELSMEAKHSVEKHTAHQVGCFTTVSQITAQECKQLLDITPGVVTPNAFEMNFVPKGAKFDKKRKEARDRLLKVASRLIGYTPHAEALLVGIGGRYEYRNKGIDQFIDAVNCLKTNKELKKEIIALILVPAWCNTYREDLKTRMNKRSIPTSPLPDPYITHTLFNMEQDKVVNQIRARGFKNEPGDNVKIVFVPVYLTGSDGIFDKTYYDLLIGLDLTVFPSYYEPWGYTPMESMAFAVPTITTDKAGFGIWCSSQVKTTDLNNGVFVTHRDDDNYESAVSQIAQQIVDFAGKSEQKTAKIREKAQQLATKANWDNFIQHYLHAYEIALSKAKQ